MPFQCLSIESIFNKILDPIHNTSDTILLSEFLLSHQHSPEHYNLICSVSLGNHLPKGAKIR